mmetsp:Transcript_8262/g.23726  ORF Transcript_8262/g.23726 Transcript_8262/m.23726 type:complete len:205 (-) Transcript_8262:262-876(-)
MLVCEEEHDRAPLYPSQGVQLLQVLPEILNGVPAGDLHLEAHHVCHVSSKPCKRLLSTTAHSNDHGIASRLAKYPGEPGDMLDGLLEEDEMEGVGSGMVVVFLVVIHQPGQLGDICDFLILALIGRHADMEVAAKHYGRSMQQLLLCLGDLEADAAHVVNLFVEQLLVCRSVEAVVEDTASFVDPEPRQCGVGVVLRHLVGLEE